MSPYSLFFCLYTQVCYFVLYMCSVSQYRCSFTCVHFGSLAGFLHVSILTVLLAFYMCSLWYYCCLFTGIPFGSIAVLLQVSFFLAVSQSFYSLFTGVLFGSIAVFLYVIFASITIFLHVSFQKVTLSFYTCPFKQLHCLLQVYFLEVLLSWKTFVTCQVVSQVAPSTRKLWFTTGEQPILL